MQTEQTFVQLLIQGLGTEVSRIIKIKSLYLALIVIKGGRKITLYYFRAFISCMFLTAAIFSGLIYNLNNMYFEFDMFNGSVLFVAMASSVAIVWNLREKRWLETFGIQDELTGLMSLYSPLESVKKNENTFDEGSIEEVIEKILNRKFAEVEKPSWSESPTNFFQ
jgi:hypothetical protein